jgi:hypothetical protein
LRTDISRIAVADISPLSSIFSIDLYGMENQYQEVWCESMEGKKLIFLEFESSSSRTKKSLKLTFVIMIDKHDYDSSSIFFFAFENSSWHQVMLSNKIK